LRLAEQRDRKRTAAGILDEPIPTDFANPALRPKRFVRVPEIKIRKAEKRNQRTRGDASIEGWGSYWAITKNKRIKSRGSRARKKIKEKNRNRPRFQIVQTASAFGGAARHFTITSEEQGFGPRDFMQRAKPLVLRLMRENRQTTINLILNCEMVRQDLISGNTETIIAHFRTRTAVNLEGNDDADELRIFLETMEEGIFNFN